MLSVTSDGSLEPGCVKEVFTAPVRPFYKVTTKTGLQIQCAGTHKLRTDSGWVKCENLSEGGFICTARKGVFGQGDANIDLLRLYGLLIGDGCLHAKDNCVTIGSIYREYQNEIRRLCKSLGYRVRENISDDDVPGRKRSAPITYFSIYGDITGRLWKDDLRVPSGEKHIPGWITSQKKENLVEFLRYLFSTDGWVYTGDIKNEIGYSTTSRQLSEDVLFLLRKFRIIARRTKRKSSRRGKVFGDMWQIVIRNRDDITRFINEIGFFGARHNQKIQRIDYSGKDRKYAKGIDVLPVSITKKYVSVDVPASKKDGSTYAKKSLRGKKKGRGKVQRAYALDFAVSKGLDELKAFCSNDVFWDTIERIERIEDQKGYDFQVEGNHNYVANGIISHNSYGARAMAMLLAYKFPIVVVLVRSRLVTLKRNHILPAKNELRDWLEEGIIDYNEQDKIFYMPSGGMVMFMHCSRPADVDQFEGVAGDLYILEEAGHYSYDMMIGMMKNNRSSDIAINRGVSYRPRTLFTFNWGGQGHSTLRRWFWDRHYEENENAKNYAYIFAPLAQNTALLSYNPEYVDNLKALPKQLREAYLIGDPDAFIGTMFTIIRTFHEVDPVGLLAGYNQGRARDQWRLPDDWRIMGSLDAGIGAPCSFGLYAMNPEGTLYKLFTYYDIKPSAPAHVKAICDRIRNCRWTAGQSPEFIVSDNYAFQSSNTMGAPGGDITWEDLFALEGMPLHRVKYNRITAIMGLQSALHYELDDQNESLEVEPKLQLFEGLNEKLIEELQAARRSEVNPEDIDKDAADHAIDETKNMVLTAESPPAYVPLKKVKKPSREKDYGSRIDRLKELFSPGKPSENDFRRAL